MYTLFINQLLNTVLCSLAAADDDEWDEEWDEPKSAATSYPGYKETEPSDPAGLQRGNSRGTAMKLPLNKQDSYHGTVIRIEIKEICMNSSLISSNTVVTITDAAYRS